MEVTDPIPPDPPDTGGAKPKRRKNSNEFDSEGNPSNLSSNPSTSSGSPIMKRQKTDTIIPPEDSSSEEFEGFADSSGKGDHIVVITPSPGEAANFFSNNVKIYRLLVDSCFGKSGILANIRNLKKKIQSVKIKTLEYIDEILKMEKLGEFNIKCHLIGKNKRNADQNPSRMGVIGPIGKDTNPEEVKEILLEEGQLVSKVERIYSRKTKTPTNLMTIWFETEILPEVVFFMAERFKVRPFVGGAYQCYNCQELGHIARTCENPTKCVICAGEHKLENCPNKENGNKKCANCEGDHTASYSKCPFIIKEKEVQTIRATEGLSYSDAVKKQKMSKTSGKTSSNIVKNNNVSTKYPKL